MANRLGWHISDNLRWLADNKAADYLPCGMLHGSFLMQVADGYENLVAENRRLRAAQVDRSPKGQDNADWPDRNDESAVAESDAPKPCRNLSGDGR